MYKKRKKCKFMVTVFLLSSAYELETHSCKCLAVCLAINIEQHKMCNDNIKKSISFPHFKKKKKKKYLQEESKHQNKFIRSFS